MFLQQDLKDVKRWTERMSNKYSYRPITCEPTTYKIITAAIANRIYNHLTINKKISTQQKGYCKSSMGCKDQLLISKLITALAKKKQRNLSVAWIDYQKAFDSVPHTWIIDVMKIYKIPSAIVKVIELTIMTWKPKMILPHTNEQLTTGKICIRRGIYQGDSMSPLLFCLTLIPLTNILNRKNLGYEVDQNKVSNILYMDNLKLFAKDEYQLEKALNVVKNYGHYIQMNFGIDKCDICIGILF